MIKFPVYVLMLVTAYTASPDECGKADGIMANGERAVAGVHCAADHLPFGTRIRLPDGSERIVGDRFGGGYTDRLDLFMETKEEAIEFGRRWMFVEVIKDENFK